MDGNFQKLTNAAYKLVEFFPESDPLKNKAKEKVLAVMENLLLISESGDWVSFKDYFSENRGKAKIEILKDITLILGYFEIAKAQGWVSSINCFIISSQYEKIKQEIGAVGPVLEQEKAVKDKLTARQIKIVDFLKVNEKAQVMNLQAALPNVTKRTIRRDLDELLKIEKIQRFGEFNQVFYRIKG